MPRTYIRTSAGWQDLAIVGPQGPVGPAGAFGTPTADVSFGGYKATNLADPTNAQDAVTKAFFDARVSFEGAADFSATGIDYTIPNGSWGTPGWYSPLVVGPNQVWQCFCSCAYRCATTAHPLYHAPTFRDSTGAALSGAYGRLERSTLGQPANVTQNFTDICIGRLTTDGTVPANTTVRVQQQFNGIGANGRVLRDGGYYWVQAWRVA